jgi:hypothetical protein
MLEQVLVIGDQTTRRLFWAHVLRLFNNEDLIKTKLGTAYAAGHFHTQMKHQSVVTTTVDDKRGSDKGTYRSLIDATPPVSSECMNVECSPFLLPLTLSQYFFKLFTVKC